MWKSCCNNKLLFRKCQEELIKNATDVQFLFEVDGDLVKVPANKAMLAVSSPVFNAMFNGELKETGDVKITDASPGAFQEFLQFFSDSQVTLTMENIAEVLKLADKYDVADCMPVCSDFLKKNMKIDDIFWMFHLALQFNLDDLKAFCEHQICQNIKNVFGMITFEKGRLQVASDKRLSNLEFENIVPHLFMISTNICSNMAAQLDSAVLPVTLSTSTKWDHLVSVENIQFSINKTMLLTNIFCSQFKSSIGCVLQAFVMSIDEKPDSNSSNIKPWHKQRVRFSYGDDKKNSFGLQPPVRIEAGKTYLINFSPMMSDQDSKALKVKIPNQPIEMATGIHISFSQQGREHDHTIVSQLYFKYIC